MDDRLIKRFFDGKATREERILVMEYFASGELDADVEKRIKDVLDSPNSPHIIWDDQRNFDLLKSKIRDRYALGREDIPELLANKPSEPTGKIKKNILWPKIAYAAAAILIIFVVFHFMNYELPGNKSQASIDWLEKQTSTGQRTTFYLNDGTRVILNSDSEIRYPPAFDSKERIVEVQGEVFFDVKHNPDSPFKVKCGLFETRVLGTSFIVNSIQSDLQVSLKTGKVEVFNLGLDNNKEKIAALKPGEQLSVKNGEIQTGRFKDIKIFGWTDGILYFEDTGLKEVLMKLEKWYNVSIQVQGTFSPDEKYSGTFENESLENVLKGLSFVYRFEYEIQGAEIIIVFP